MKRIHVLLLGYFLFTAALPLSAQLTGIIEDCDAPLPPEQIVLHTDRDKYLVGEKIWFKAYCWLDGQPGRQLSKVLYVELFDAESKALIQQKFQIEDGVAMGALEIPEEVQAGRHFLRAYTQYLRNFPLEHFAHRLLTIVNPESEPTVLSRPKQDSLNCLLADKTLVAGLLNRLLVCFDPAFCNQKERVTLQNERGENIAECSALYHGCALFDFTPEAGTAYQAVLIMDNGKPLRKSLPPAQNTGLSCRIDALGKSPKVSLRRHPKASPTTVSVRIFSESLQLLDSRIIDMQEPAHHFMLPMENLSPGIYYAVVGNQGESTPRVYPFYHEGPSPLPLTLMTDQTSYGAREKVTLNIEGPAGTNCQLSASVRKSGLGVGLASFPDFLWGNTWLLPSYLPDGRNWKKNQMEMALMLLADQLNKENRVSSFGKSGLQWIPEIRGLTLSGLMRNKEIGAAVDGEIGMAAVVGKEPQVHLTETKADGPFLFALHNVEGKQNLFVGWKGAGGTPPEILINNNFSNRFPEITPVPLIFEAEQHDLFEEMYLQAQLSAAFEPDTQENAFAAIPPILPITNIDDPDYTVEVTSFVAIPTLEEVFREIVPYVLVRRKKGKAYLEVFNESAQQAYDDPLVLLDNIPVFDIGRLLEINPGSIEKIEVINSNYLLGDYLFGGLVSIHTNTDDFASYQWTEQSVFMSFQAISPGVDFQHPVYPSSEARASPKPDFRPMLYWNPSVQTGAENTNLEFYTSGLSGTFEVIVRGFTGDGKPCFGSTFFEVRERQ